jgi:hypothetical protein
MIKKTVEGTKGKTVLFSPNIVLVGNTISFENFIFYTPIGNSTDREGFTCFPVQSDSVVIERDGEFDKYFWIVVTNGIPAYHEVFEGGTPPVLSFGLEGDIIVRGRIPSDISQEIYVETMEVIEVTQ